jgi:phosphohistidine phosphatase
MRQLLLLRHAKASWDDPQMPDHSRPLHPRGRADTGAMRDAMQTFGIRADLVLVSSARRTLQTLQGLAPWIAPPAVEPMDGLYLASATDILHILRQVTPTMRDVMLIGHNPGIHDLALLIADRNPADTTIPGAAILAETYPTLGLAQFAVPDDWASIGPGRAQLQHFLAPADLRDREA